MAWDFGVYSSQVLKVDPPGCQFWWASPYRVLFSLSMAPQMDGGIGHLKISQSLARYQVFKKKKKKGCAWVVILGIMENYGQLGSPIPQLQYQPHLKLSCPGSDCSYIYLFLTLIASLTGFFWLPCDSFGVKLFTLFLYQIKIVEELSIHL